MMRRASQPAPDDRLERLRAEVQLMRERNANPSSEHENVKAEIVRQRVPTLDAVLRAINRLIAEQPSARPAPAPDDRLMTNYSNTCRRCGVHPIGPHTCIAHPEAGPIREMLLQQDVAALRAALTALVDASRRALPTDLSFGKGQTCVILSYAMVKDVWDARDNARKLLGGTDA